MDKQLLLTILKPAHGLFNLLVLTLFLYQAWEGILIRRARLGGSAIPFSAVKTHRKIGPISIILAIAGYFAGIFLVWYDTGDFVKHPLHLATGSLLILTILASYLVSRRIKADTPALRTVHFRLGIIVLTLFLVEIVLGLGILF